MTAEAPVPGPSHWHPRGMQPHLAHSPPASLASASRGSRGSTDPWSGFCPSQLGAILEIPSGGMLCDSVCSPPLSEPGLSWLLNEGADGRFLQPRPGLKVNPCPVPAFPEEEGEVPGQPPTPAPCPRHRPARTWLRPCRRSALLRPGPPGLR